MTLYAAIFCAGFLNGPMHCAPQPGPDAQSLKECKKTIAKQQKSTGLAIVKLPNGLVAVRRWECAEKTSAEGQPPGVSAPAGSPP